MTRLCFLMENYSFESSISLFKREITEQVRHKRMAIREKDECQFVKCCFSCPKRLPAKHAQEGNTKSDICMCAASTMFALSRGNHMKQDSKGEIQQDSLLYCHGNPTLMKRRKTIKYPWKKRKAVPWIPMIGEKVHSWAESGIVTCGWSLIIKSRVQLLGNADFKAIIFLNYSARPVTKFRFICEKNCSFRLKS